MIPYLHSLRLFILLVRLHVTGSICDYYLYRCFLTAGSLVKNVFTIIVMFPQVTFSS